MTWRQRAACHPDLRPEGMDRAAWVRQWYPGHGGPPVAPGAAICARCPVRGECLEAGMGERYGVWGGLTLEARIGVRGAHRRPIVHGTTAGYKAHRRRGEAACRECLAAVAAAQRRRAA